MKNIKTPSKKPFDKIIIIFVAIIAVEYIGKKLFYDEGETGKQDNQLVFNVFVSDPETTLNNAQECSAIGSKYEKILSAPGIKFKFNYINLYSLPEDFEMNFDSAGIMKTQTALTYKIESGVGRTLAPTFSIKKINSEGKISNEGEFQIITLKTSDAKTLTDLENKSVITPPLENKTAVPVNFFLSKNEVKFKEILSYENIKEGLSALNENQVDSLIYYPGKPEVENYLKEHSIKMTDYKVLYTSNYKYPLRVLYKSIGETPESTKLKSGFIRNILNTPEKLKAFIYCTRTIPGEEITPEKWDEIQKMYLVSSKFLKQRSTLSK